MIMEKEKLIALVKGAQSGDSEAANELFCAFYDDLYYHALKTVGDSDTALDVTQEAFVEILNTIGNLKEPAAFVTWAKQITYHQCTRHFKKKVDITVDEDEDGRTIFDNIQEEKTEFIPDEALDKDDFKKTILSFISSLPEEQRAAVMMYYFDEMSVREIAEIQGLSEGTVKSRLNYARKGIKEQVEAFEEKNGIKLHAIPFFPLFGWLFKGAFEGALPAAKVAALAEGVSAATGVTVTATATAAAATSAAAASAATTTAAATTATLGAKLAATPLAVKIISGILAASIVVGGSAAVIFGGDKDKDNPSSTPTVSQPADDMQGQGGDKEHIHSFNETTRTKEFGVVNINATIKTCECGETQTEGGYINILPTDGDEYCEYLDCYFENTGSNHTLYPDLQEREYGGFNLVGLFAAGDFIVSSPHFDEGSIEISADEYYKALQKYFKLSSDVIAKMKEVRPGDTYTVVFDYHGSNLMEGDVVWLGDNIYRVYFKRSGSHVNYMELQYVDVEYNKHTGGENKILSITSLGSVSYNDSQAIDINMSLETLVDNMLSLKEMFAEENYNRSLAGEYAYTVYYTDEEANRLYKAYQLLDVFGYNLTFNEFFGKGWAGFSTEFDGDTLKSVTIRSYLPVSSSDWYFGRDNTQACIDFAKRGIDKFISLAGGLSNITGYYQETNSQDASTPAIDIEDTIYERVEALHDRYGDNENQIIKIALRTNEPLTIGDKKVSLSYTNYPPSDYNDDDHAVEFTVSFE